MIPPSPCSIPLLLVLAAALLSNCRAAEPFHYLASPWTATALLPPPPLPGSPEQSADLDSVRQVHHWAGSNTVALVEAKVNLSSFAPAVGGWLEPGKFPRTEGFLERVLADAKAATTASKNYWKRPRPFVVDTSLASDKAEKSHSYPSGHSTESMVLGLVLVDRCPAKREAILAQARAIGWHRVELARHYPTDIYAGRVLAQAIFRDMNTNDLFRRDDRADQQRFEYLGKTREPDAAIPQLHRQRPQPKQHGPTEATSRPFIQDRQVDGPDRN